MSFSTTPTDLYQTDKDEFLGRQKGEELLMGVRNILYSVTFPRV